MMLRYAKVKEKYNNQMQLWKENFWIKMDLLTNYTSQIFAAK